MFTEFLPAAILVGLSSLFTTGAMVYTHFKAAFTEPGIVPRGTDKEEPTELVREEELDGRKVVISYCKTCLIWKPPRCHHCRTCNNCVLEFDHHCPWVGNCVGLNNYKWFNLFLWAVIAGCVYLFIVCAVGFGIALSETDATIVGVIKAKPYHLGILVYTLFIFISIVSLCGYHCNLMCKGKTTYESIKKIEEGSDGRTGWQRLWDTIFEERESRFNLRNQVDREMEETSLFLDHVV